MLLSVRYPTLRPPFQLRPRLPGLPTLLKLRLCLIQGRHAIRARHRTVDRHRPEPAQAVGAAAGLVDAAAFPIAGNGGVIRPVLVDPGAEASRAELERHRLRWVLGFRHRNGRTVQCILRTLDAYLSSCVEPGRRCRCCSDRASISGRLMCRL